ncbi:MAG: GGDEF domain-containing protein [Chloroflexota bacterium]|nr:MAG: hypothetical protein DIU80_01120 [Chloroflexota bacterium]
MSTRLARLIGRPAAALAIIGWLGLAAASLRWRRLSLIDDATGVYNRRYLFQRLKRELRRSRLPERPLSLIVLEVDDMKRCNDRYGHLVGDALLAAVAQALRAEVRSSDAVARWGGDEFALILPGMALREALLLAERVRARVAALAVDDGRGRAARSTVSVGVAVCNHAGATACDLLDRADRAMYAAKQQKNRVALAT